jgi:hypothetical protein
MKEGRTEGNKERRTKRDLIKEGRLRKDGRRRKEGRKE